MSPGSLDGFVLAGGRSTRMGVDKARLAFPGSWPMAGHVAFVLSEVCGRVALIRRDADGLAWPRPDGGAWEVIDEPHTHGAHPLNGLVTACAHAVTPWVVVAPCDAPFLPAAAVRALIAASSSRVGSGGSLHAPLAAAAVAVCAGRVHPLIGVFPRAAGVRAAELVAAGASAHELVAEAARVELPEGWLRNVNGPEDLGRPGVRAALAARLRWVRGPALERVLVGETARLAARGAVDLPL